MVVQGSSKLKVRKLESLTPWCSCCPAELFICTGQRCPIALVRCCQLPLSGLCHVEQVAELAPESCRGVERAVPFLTADEGIGSRVVLETIDSAITGCAHPGRHRHLCAGNAGFRSHFA